MRGIRFGPGILVTAAFVGPGTITTASSAGASFGFALIWALLFSIIATLVLQEMAARLGLVTRAGLAEALRESFRSRWLGRGAVILVIAAVGLGNAAYEAGNIAGAALALASVTPLTIGNWSLIITVLAGILLWAGRYVLLERILITLVLLMSLVFIATAWAAQPDMGEMLTSLLQPSLPSGSALTAIALIGTTVVPYNLFLQANAVREKWPAHLPLDRSLRESRIDTGLSVGLGGLITLAILSTSATAFFATGTAFDSGSMATQLQPLLGEWARPIFAAGLFAGGMTSAITAPLAAAYAVCGAMNWPTGLHTRTFRLVWASVLLTGGIFATLGTKPIAAIIFAQAANGLLLPVVAVFLLIVMNRKALLGERVNGLPANILGGLVVLIAVSLGLVKLGSVFGIF